MRPFCWSIFFGADEDVRDSTDWAILKALAGGLWRYHVFYGYPFFLMRRVSNFQETRGWKERPADSVDKTLQYHGAESGYLLKWFRFPLMAILMRTCRSSIGFSGLSGRIREQHHVSFLLLLLSPFLSLFDTPKIQRIKCHWLSCYPQLPSLATACNSHAHISLCLLCRPAASCSGLAGGRLFSGMALGPMALCWNNCDNGW